MTKRDLVIHLAERLGYTQGEVANVVQAVLDTITQTLVDGGRIEIRNFGVFELKKRNSRMGRNPRSGEQVPIAQKNVATFKPGKALKVLGERSGARPWPEPAAPEPAPEPAPAAAPPPQQMDFGESIGSGSATQF
ncbi:MAG: integration host factor subunit beta [Candidatus Hydrogenedentes bacterium]|nr:integration host factor subunit beta [Candidatus Hydrogenedentota bacterium]